MAVTEMRGMRGTRTKATSGERRWRLRRGLFEGGSTPQSYYLDWMLRERRWLRGQRKA
jgi:hypothetical protein